MEVSIMGNYIQNYIIYNIKFLESYLNLIPEQWRFWIYNIVVDKGHLFNNSVLYTSYIDGLLLSKITNLKMCYLLKYILNKIETRNKYDGSLIYSDAMFSVNELFIEFESVLYYKYCVLKKGLKKNYCNNFTSETLYSVNTYQEIYQINFLILKIMIFYIWDFEYSIFKDLNKITKWYIIENINLEYGYHIYSKDKNNYNPYEPAILKVNIKDYESYVTFNYNNKHFYNLNNDNVYELIYILSCLSGLKLFSTTKECTNLLYIHYKNNKDLINILKIQNKYSAIISRNDNDLSLLEKDKVHDYFNELKNIMDDFYMEWKLNCDKKSNQHDKVFQELIAYYKKKCE